MATKLVAISGPLRESEFPLCAQVAIGRDAGNIIRQNFILGAVLAEGLGIFAFVLGVLIIFLK